MELNVLQVYSMMSDYYKRYENRIVTPRITVGKVVSPSIKGEKLNVVNFGIEEKVTDKYGETRINRTMLDTSEFERVMQIELNDLGYEVTGLEYRYVSLSEQNVSFSGLSVSCEKRISSDKQI